MHHSCPRRPPAVPQHLFRVGVSPPRNFLQGVPSGISLPSLSVNSETPPPGCTAGARGFRSDTLPMRKRCENIGNRNETRKLQKPCLNYVKTVEKIWDGTSGRRSCHPRCRTHTVTLQTPRTPPASVSRCHASRVTLAQQEGGGRTWSRVGRAWGGGAGAWRSLPGRPPLRCVGAPLRPAAGAENTSCRWV